jgi:predicted nucleotidyltransferase
MDLTEQQVRTIQDWAQTTRYVSEVRLFGSRAKGCARPDSDIDLAITVGGTNPGLILGNYLAMDQRWQDELSSLLSRKVHVALYNDADPEPVRNACDECSVLLFPLKALLPPHRLRAASDFLLALR